jgi:hypothetical protein
MAHFIVSQINLIITIAFIGFVVWLGVALHLVVLVSVLDRMQLLLSGFFTSYLIAYFC